MRSIIRRLLKIEPGISLWQWAVDRISNNWPTITAAFLGFGGMTILSAITDWLVKWGPVAWGAIGLISTLLIVLVISIIRLINSKRSATLARATFEETMSKQPNVINILDRQFNNVVIPVSSMFRFYDPILEAKQFIDCDLIGPGVIAVLDRCELVGNRISASVFVVIDPQKPYDLEGAIGFRSTRFENCRIVNVVFIVDPETARKVRQQTAEVRFIGLEF